MKKSSRGQSLSLITPPRPHTPSLALPHLCDHLVVGVPQQGDALQGGDRPGEQGHVWRHGEGDLQGRAQEVLGEGLVMGRG